MKLKECITCGSHNFTDNKCDYCGNVYEDTDDKEVKEVCDDKTESYTEKEEYIQDFKETPEGKKLLKVMIFILVSIVWFAICVFIPQLFLITVCSLIIWVCRKVCKK